MAERGVHPHDEMPFQVAWTDGIGKPEFLEGFVGFHLGQRAGWSRDDWSLELSVWASGEPIGFQGLNGDHFAETRVVITGSWLGAEFQGRGYGTEMRAAVLELAFAGLGASIASSAYQERNVASKRVSEKLGYEDAGECWHAPRGLPSRHLKLELTAARWAGLPHPPVEIEGLEPCLPLFGLA